MSWRIFILVVVACGLLAGVRGAVATGDKAVIGDKFPANPKQLAEERLGLARRAYEAVWGAFKPFDLTKGDGEDVYRWSRRWMESERDTAKAKAERVAVVEAHFERMKKLEQEVQMYARGSIPFQQLAATQFYRAEAEIWLAEEKAK